MNTTETKWLTARIDGQGLIAGREYAVDNIQITDDGFFVISTATIATFSGIKEIKNAPLAFDLGIE
jgi:hypothetical protein